MVIAVYMNLRLVDELHNIEKEQANQRQKNAGGLKPGGEQGRPKEDWNNILEDKRLGNQLPSTKKEKEKSKKTCR